MKLAALSAVVLLAGCASITPQQCRQPYDLGFRDAIMGGQAQDLVWAPLCTQQGAPLDSAAYIQGWKDGRFEYEKRTPHVD